MARICFTIVNPSGNLTALVETGVPKSKKVIVAKRILSNFPTIEQVGFNVNGNFEMMAGELSLLGTLAFGYWQSYIQKNRLVKFKSSGLEEKVIFKKEDNCGSIIFNLPKIKFGKINDFDFVDLGEIAYFFLPRKTSPFEASFEKYRKTISRNAWGIVYYNKNKIWPYIFVEKNGILLEKRLENACGSGSLAYFLISKQEKIIQPSGKVLEIKKIKNKFLLKGKVKIISRNYVEVYKATPC